MSSIRKTTEHQDPYNLPNMAAAVEATATAAAGVEATATAAAAVEATVTVVGEAASALASAAAAAAAEAIGAGLTAYERGALILMATSPTYRSMRRPAWAYRASTFSQVHQRACITITAAT
jgi:hypothetical protein